MNIPSWFRWTISPILITILIILVAIALFIIAIRLTDPEQDMLTEEADDEQ